MSPDKQIKTFINRLRFWLFARELLAGLFWGLAAGALLGAVFEIISFFIPWYAVHYWAAGAVSCGILAALVRALLRYPSAKKAALTLDQTGLKERTVTALFLAGDDSLFANLQKKDAWEHLSPIRLRKQLPLSIRWRQPAVLVLTCLVLGISCLLPSPAKEKAQTTHQVVQKAKKEIEKVKKAEEDLAKEDSAQKKGEQKELEEYRKLMDSIRKELADAKTQEDLDKALERASRKLNQTVAKTSQKTLKSNMQQLASSLSGEKAGSQASQETQAAAKEQADEARKLMEKLAQSNDLKKLTQEEQKALQEALKQLSGSTSDAALQQALNQLSSQLSSGNFSADALASAQAAVSALSQQLNQQLASNGGQGTSGSNGQNAGNSGSDSDSQSGGNGQGQGNGSGSGNGQGSGSGSGNGSGSGGGSGIGTGWNYGSTKGKQKDISYDGEMVSIPNKTGNDSNLTGRKKDGTSYTTKGGEALTWSGSQVDYGKVIGEYSDQALSKIGSSSYPAGVQDIVKSYFEDLNQ